MRRISTALGLPKQQNRAATVQALVDHFADPARVRALVHEVPADIRATLQDMDAEDWSDRAWRTRRAAVDWAEPRGLLIQSGYSHLWQVPAEVARALSGPDYAAPFTPLPPTIATRTPKPATVERESSAAATVFAAGLLALLDHLARTPVATLKSGGLGARELTRLGKTLGTDERTLRLALELAQDCDLLDTFDATVTVSAQFAVWRDAPPEVQFAAVVEAWWSLGSTPTEARDADDKVQRALVRRGLYCEGCLLARQAMVVVLDRFGATDRASLLEQVHWWHPAVHTSPDDAPLADQWGEAELLGVIADGAVSDLGRALLAEDDRNKLEEIARRLLPATAQHATFGSDLTAFVAGTPAGRVTSVLDAAADREGRGGAITWRFSAASVRRAFGDGATADGLLDRLAAVSQAELPQPLRYLIADVARRHGHLRLAPATAVMCSDDPALLALVAADRKLAKSGPRLLAPTFLAADVDVDTLLKALRSAGYFPVRNAAAPVPATGQPAAPLDAAELQAAINAWGQEAGISIVPAEPEPPGAPLDLLELARGLKAAKPKAPGKTITERVLGRLNRTLSTTELRQLAHAIDTGGSVGIVYASASDKITERVISEIQLMGTSLSAWCGLRSDDREFSVSRIRSVFPVR
ncbi:helicase-associated domain-containing protein [uncultured Jatrophihabitans sp.]|uniref:helicase-associated domain-containing protein n=1 Tax=uncultured Jatrophihabitans sp. TaxID=1610747 RepID=UPI0035C9685B